MSNRVKITRPPEEDRHPRTGGYICDLCVKAMVISILDEVVS